ncbi:MAG: histidine phosphatase family protein, partial [Acidobacteria bacterium]|nr:histidine phosphatase family protein [Acidobacteriota bacterium]
MRLLLVIALSLSMSSLAASQNKIIVLVRHAEKAGENAMDKTGDPDLSPDGQARAKKLLAFAKRYKPHEIFATATKRAQETAAPIAEYRHKQVQ